jgi:hypothetical protein
MPWKMDGDKLAIENGNPVWAYDDGKTATIDGGHTMQKIADLTNEAATRRRELRDAQEKLTAFEGLDPAAARKAIDTVKNFDDKKLIDAGEAERVKNEAIKAVEEKYKPVVEKAQKLESDFYEEKIGGSFAKSDFVQKRIAIPADLVQEKFGKAFKVEDGKVVAYDESGNKIYSRERPGELAGFDEALSTLIDRYPHKDRILLDSGRSGGGASGGGAGTGRKTINLNDFNKLAPKDRAAFMQDGGAITE